MNIAIAYSFESADKNYFAIIMNRAERNLLEFMNSMNRITDRNGAIRKLSPWFGCLAGVTAYIHGIGITHQDVKPENVLIKGDQIMLADFGISKMGLGKTLSTTMPEWLKPGPPKYVAPEVGDGSTCGRSADIFSLGTVFLEMLLSYSYPRDRQRLRTNISAFGGPSYSKNLPNLFIYSFCMQAAGLWQCTN